MYKRQGHAGLADPPNVSSQDFARTLGPALANPAIEKVGHDMKFVSLAGARVGVALDGPIADTLVMSYLVDATRSSHTLDSLALERTNYRAATEESVAGKGAKALALDEVPATSLSTFASERADLPLSMAPALIEDLQREGLSNVYRDLELPLIPVLADIELAGVKVDTTALAELGGRMQAELDDLTGRIYDLGSGEFNINSPKQLGDILFVRLGLQPTESRRSAAA